MGAIKLIVTCALFLITSNTLANPLYPELDAKNIANHPGCINAKNIPYPQKDLPTDKEVAELKGCHPALLFYGAGIPIDYTKARKCAYLGITTIYSPRVYTNNPTKQPPVAILAQGFEDDADFMSSNHLLAMIYANGLGVKKNLNLARKFICLDVTDSKYQTSDKDSINIAVDNGIGIVDSMETDSHRQLRICDMINYNVKGVEVDCEVIETNAERVSTISQIISNHPQWSAEAVKAFENLVIAEGTFRIKENDEINQGGTIAPYSIDSTKAAIDDEFFAMFNNIASGKAISVTDAKLKQDDDQLNKTYQKVQKLDTSDDSDSNWGTVKKSDIRSVEKAWIHYKDSWVSNSRILFPDININVIKDMLIKNRIKALECFETGSTPYGMENPGDTCAE